MRTTTSVLFLIGLTMMVGAAASQDAPAVEAVPAAEAAPGGVSSQGFIYGTVETRSGNTYKGILRWGTEESFWGDHFNSAKEDLPYRRGRRRSERRRNRIEIFGITVGYRWDDDSWRSRQFISRFGDIAEIEVRGGNDLDVRMKNGERLELEGASNDVGARITVLDESLGEVKLEWKKIDRIVFSAAPASAKPPARRLYGELTTEDDEKFVGFIQWDLQECLSTDELDGETDDGDLAIPMGRIVAIEKRNRRGAWVEMEDGRRLLLEGTNDVDSSNDGIFVEDERFGRVEVPWEEFVRLEFRTTDSSGPGYDSYRPGRRLSGTVTDTDGRTHKGDVVIDLDESQPWEILNGDRFGVEYYIPLGMVRSIEPLDRDASLVRLKNGQVLELEGGTDVSEDNDGVVVVKGDGETYLAWDEVKLIELD